MLRLRLQQFQQQPACRPDIGVDVSNVSSNSSFAFFLQFRSVLFAALQRFFGHVRVHVYANSAIAAHFQSFEALSQNDSNLCLWLAGFQSFNDAAHFLNLLELSPDFFGDLLGQGFNAPRTPAASIGLSIPNSSCSITCRLRAIRRENTSPLRISSSNGGLS